MKIRFLGIRPFKRIRRLEGWKGEGGTRQGRLFLKGLYILPWVAGSQ